MFSRKKLENSKSWILLRQHKQSLGWPRWPPPPHNRCHLDYFQHFEKKTIHPPSSKKLESTWVLVLDDTLGKKYSGRFLIKNVRNFFTHLMRENSRKKIVYNWTTTGPIKLYIYITKDVLSYFIISCGKFCEGKNYSREFSVKLLCIFDICWIFRVHQNWPVCKI